MGTVTPTKIASYSLCVAGLLLLVAGRLVESLQGNFPAGMALLLLGISCLIDTLPGGSQISDEQVAMIRHAGIPYRDGWEKVVSAVIGAMLLAGSAYLVVA